MNFLCLSNKHGVLTICDQEDLVPKVITLSGFLKSKAYSGRSVTKMYCDRLGVILIIRNTLIFCVTERLDS